MPINFNQPPYYDDFTKDDLVYKLLFQPGRAVQARELTQIQSLLQDQISSLGKHIFKDGSLVFGGELNYDKTNTKWLAIKELDFKGSPNLIRSITPGLFIRRSAQAEGVSWNPRTYGKVTEVIPAENGEPDTIYFQWEEGEPEEGQTGFGSNENLIIYDQDRQVARFPITTLAKNAEDKAIHYGTASKISVKPGIYFWKGLFIRSTGGSIVLGKYNQNTTYRIGFSVNEIINTSNPKSLDPASGSSNYAAPGADRYEIKLQLQKYGPGSLPIDETILENFIEIARVVDGDLITTPQDQTIYNILADKLAQRTYEESGNYLAKPYDITVKNKTSQDNPKLIVKMSDGIAYVKGYRRSLTNQNTVEIDKGRGVQTESIEVPHWYGDNRVLIYDHANSSMTNNKENANGLFTIGSGAGIHTSNAWYGERGSAVSLHCVPHDQVQSYSLTDQWKWNSTLVGTARPIQMSYDRGATNRSIINNRRGMVYNLWLDDFNSSPITNAVSVTNILNDVSAYGNAEFGTFHFNAPSVAHGITTNDHISITGQSSWDTFTGASVSHVNATAIHVAGDYSGFAASDTDGLSLSRTTGNTTGLNTVVLNEYASAAWNDSYTGSTIRINDGTRWSEPRTIVGYAGTDSTAETLWKNRVNTDAPWSKRATVILNKDLDIAPVAGYTYELTLTSKQARSVVHNYNKSSTGAEQYPATLSQMWNIDPISGIVSNVNYARTGWWTGLAGPAQAAGDKSQLTDDFYGGRMGGDCIYNRHGKEWEDALLFPTGKMATKSVMTDGELDSGLTSKTYLYYTEYIKRVSDGTGATQLFSLPADANYVFSTDGPDIYPYTSQTITNTDQIRANFALVNRTTGEILTSYITQVVINNSPNPATASVTLAVSGKYTVGADYILNTQVRLKNVGPAYKKLVTANDTNSITLPASGSLTEFSRGQILIDSAAYGTTQGSHISLKKPDVFKLKKVIHNVDNAAANTDLANTQLDITDRFILDTGQRNSFYDNGSIELKGTAPTGNLLVCFDYFQRMDLPKSDDDRVENLDSPSYFAVDSYQTTTDVTFSEPSSISFAAGDLVTANDGAIGYIVDFANTAGYAKARIEDVVGNFNVGEFITKGDAAGKIKTVTTADLRYSEIPSYTSPAGSTFMLRNAIDMRAYVSTNDQVSDTISDSMMPWTPSNEYFMSRRGVRFGPGWPTLPEDDVERPRVSGDAEISHYTGRIDKLVVTDSGEYTTITGVASDEPIPPREDQNGNKFTIASLEIPPYTSRADMVQIRPNIALRHTMKDISKLTKRVENLEYYVSLNALELSASELDISLADGTSRFKNGIVVDNFNGSKVRSWGPNNSVCATGQGVLRPSQETYSGRGSFDLQYITGGATTDVSSSGWRYGEPTHATIAYDTTEFISQRAATGLESVNPFDLQNFTGDLTLTPDTDHWVDTTRLPEYSAVIAGDRDNPIAELSSPEFADLTPAEIARELEKIDGLWETISGVSVGDDITGTATIYSQNESGGFDIETRARNIELGDASVQKYTALADIDAAIAHAASIDGLMKTVEILPYVRSRDVVVHATGLKPSWPAGLFFENCWIDHLYSPATQIYLNDTNNSFQPEIDGTPERISLSASGGSYTANALLVAVRDPEFLNSTITRNKMKVGYIVPEITDVDNGLIDWTTYKDGYYVSGWQSSNRIKQYGFQGTDTSITITGRRTLASTTLFGGSSHLYNGHYTGTVRNTDSGNTTHLVLSPDAHRYVSANFGSSDLSPTTATSNRTLIKIISGKGKGLECVANNLIGTETVGGQICPVIELRTASDGTNPLNSSWGGGPGVDSTSVYTIKMQSVDWLRNGISQLGYPGINTNRYGDKIGIMHIPAAYSRSEWTAGNKLIELRDRAYNASHLIKNYASAYYNAGGHRQVFYDDQTLTRLQGIRNSLSAFQINDVPGETIDATDENGTGVLGVVISVNIANGTYTAGSSQAHQVGPGEVGSVSQTDPNEMSAWQQHVKDLEDMGFVWMEDLKQFVSLY